MNKIYSFYIKQYKKKQFGIINIPLYHFKLYIFLFNLILIIKYLKCIRNNIKVFFSYTNYQKFVGQLISLNDRSIASKFCGVLTLIIESYYCYYIERFVIGIIIHKINWIDDYVIYKNWSEKL